MESKLRKLLLIAGIFCLAVSEIRGGTERFFNLGSKGSGLGDLAGLPIGSYPLWKFHKYDGLSLRPVPIGIDVGHGIPDPPPQLMTMPEGLDLAQGMGLGGGLGLDPSMPNRGGYPQSSHGGGYTQPQSYGGGYGQPQSYGGGGYAPPQQYGSGYAPQPPQGYSAPSYPPPSYPSPPYCPPSSTYNTNPSSYPVVSTPEIPHPEIYQNSYPDSYSPLGISNFRPPTQSYQSSLPKCKTVCNDDYNQTTYGAYNSSYGSGGSYGSQYPPQTPPAYPSQSYSSQGYDSPAPQYEQYSLPGGYNDAAQPQYQPPQGYDVQPQGPPPPAYGGGSGYEAPMPPPDSPPGPGSYGPPMYKRRRFQISSNEKAKELTESAPVAEQVQ